MVIWYFLSSWILVMLVMLLNLVKSEHAAPVKYHFGLSFAASGLKLLLVMVWLYFDLLSGEVCSDVVQV